MTIQFIKYVCLNCNKCLSDFNTYWCNDCFANAKAHHSVEEKIGKMEKVIYTIKFIVDKQAPQVQELMELQFGSAWSTLQKALKELDQ